MHAYGGDGGLGAEEDSDDTVTLTTVTTHVCTHVEMVHGDGVDDMHVVVLMMVTTMTRAICGVLRYLILRCAVLCFSSHATVQCSVFSSHTAAMCLVLSRGVPYHCALWSLCYLMSRLMLCVVLLVMCRLKLCEVRLCLVSSSLTAL